MSKQWDKRLAAFCSQYFYEYAFNLPVSKVLLVQNTVFIGIQRNKLVFSLINNSISLLLLNLLQYINYNSMVLSQKYLFSIKLHTLLEDKCVESFPEIL